MRIILERVLRLLGVVVHVRLVKVHLLLRLHLVLAHSCLLGRIIVHVEELIVSMNLILNLWLALAVVVVDGRSLWRLPWQIQESSTGFRGQANDLARYHVAVGAAEWLRQHREVRMFLALHLLHAHLVRFDVELGLLLHLILIKRRPTERSLLDGLLVAHAWHEVWIIVFALVLEQVLHYLLRQLVHVYTTMSYIGRAHIWRLRSDRS